ncbi:unnamed protein product [Parnassius apollo]|uniref:(apollo) hypothetical protein n=1 Tax=Parnassius apollo TaxID=110799 RepID=A0A8S3VZE6_PARAO|nr:unnamed protein product [Parnassius apollo]
MTDGGKEINYHFNCQNQEAESNFTKNNQNIPYEIFRNDTTAVEVIVKGVTGKRKKMTDTSYVNTDNRISSLIKEVEGLKRKLDEAKTNTDEIRESFLTVAVELKRQLDRAHQREIKEQTKIFALQLENLKLRSLLDSKTNLIKKLMKELISVKRVVKLVSRGFDCISMSQSPDFINNSETEYRAFEKELQNGFMMNVIGPDGITFDSTISNKL